MSTLLSPTGATWQNPLPSAVDGNMSIILNSLTQWLQQPSFPYGISIGGRDVKTAINQSNPTANLSPFSVPLTQWGETAVTTNASGGATITFPQLFPTASLAVVAQSTSGTVLVNVQGIGSATSFSIVASLGGAAVASTSMNISWIAIGH